MIGVSMASSWPSDDDLMDVPPPRCPPAAPAPLGGSGPSGAPNINANSISNKLFFQARLESAKISGFPEQPDLEIWKKQIFHFWHLVSQIEGLGKPVWNLQEMIPN